MLSRLLSKTKTAFPLKSRQRSFYTVVNPRSSWRNWRSLPPEASLYAIIGANVVIFGAWKYAEGHRKWAHFMVRNFMISTDGVLNKHRIHTMLTSMFSHNEFWHIMMNMLTLYFFGTSALMSLSVRKFLTLYLGGGLAGGACYVAWPSFSKVFGYRSSRYQPALGASAAVASVVAYGIITNPTSPLYVMGVLPVPAAVFGAAYIGFGLFNLKNGNTAESAHLGGTAFGVLFYLLRRFRP